ncbi:hypothetical protein [Marmoricola sp. RAF53]|uniref:hypothetical protein n=1 Tax=Marmoricola sp. RAF53 TaxID=3233059 RepID=UPI003F9A0EB7
MALDTAQHYFRQRPVLSAFITLPAVGLCFWAMSGVAEWFDASALVAGVLWLFGLALGLQLSRLVLTVLMGRDQRAP